MPSAVDLMMCNRESHNVDLIELLYKMWRFLFFFFEISKIVCILRCNFKNLLHFCMAKLNISDDWWTAPSEDSEGRTVLVTGRRALDNVIATGQYVYRIEMTWEYEPDKGGMPDFTTSSKMEVVTNLLQDTLRRDPVAVMTGIYTGAGERNWVFYAVSLKAFQAMLNTSLSSIEEQLPLTFIADQDPDWEEYREMCQCEIARED